MTGRSESERLRTRNWLAIALGTIVMLFSYFPYAAAFAASEGEPVRIDAGLVGIGLVVAPFVFIVLGFVSQNPKAPKRVLQSMGLLIVLGLTVGLLSPVLGAAAGFGVGGAITLSPPPVPEALKRRIWAVAGAVVYTFALLVFATPGGVLTGALLPLLAVGFADEYTMWKSAREG